MTSLVVVGGGIAGLAAAWFAADAGYTVTVLEAAPRVGGKLLVAEVGGVAVDVGAEAMLATRPEGLDLLVATGLTEDRISPSTTAARIRVGGRIHPLPARTMLGIPGDLEALRASGALSPAGLDIVATEPSQAPLPPLEDDVAVGVLVRARLGDEVVDRLVEPLLGGVYAGRVDTLSLRATIPKLAERLAHGGSLVEAARASTGGGTMVTRSTPVFASLRGGLGRLPQVLASSGRFTVRTGVTVRAIRRTTTGFALDCGAVPATELVEADRVIVATPAAKAARLLRGIAPAAATELAGIDSANVAVVSFAFSGDVVLPEGSGLLIGAQERLATKGITLTSRKWPVETDGLHVLRASVGRFGEPQALQLDDADLTRLVRRDLYTALGVDAEPVDSVVTRWGGGLPQYTVGHVERVARTRAAVAAVPGLGVCGAAYDGVGVPTCIAGAKDAVLMAGGTMES